ncbi:MAG: hypothetical protein IPJ81_12135 [Chitinophagaceae bacterium]|nr:hypothetical protein [Chitinophagaceae bacterium]
MKKYYLLLSLIIFILSFTSSTAQDTDPVIKFGNGNFVTKNNTISAKFDTKKINTTLYENNYYVAIQFNNIPGKQTLDALKEPVFFRQLLT